MSLDEGSKAMFSPSMASSAWELKEVSLISEMSDPRRWWRRPVIAPFSKAKGAA